MMCQTVCAHPALAGQTLLPGEGPDPCQVADELNDAQMAELLDLLLQEPQEQQINQQPPCTAALACQDLLSAVPPAPLEFSSAEEALDAKILQLLALKEATVQKRQLRLLQQQLAGVDPAAAGDASTEQHQLPVLGQTLDVGSDLQLRLASSPSLASCDATWPWCQGVSACSSRASIDLGCLQDTTSLQPAMPAQLGSGLAVLAPCSTAAAGPCTASDPSQALQHNLAAAYTVPGSSSALLCPDSMCAMVMPAPAVGSVPSMLSPMPSLSMMSPMRSLQDQSMLAVQQCSVSTGAPAGPLFTAGYTSNLPSAAQVQGCSSGARQAASAVVGGVVGLRSASFSGVSPFAHEAVLATHSSLQQCNVYAHTFAGCTPLLPVSSGATVAAPAASRSMRCGDPRYRRMSADSPGFRSLAVARVPAAALLGRAYPGSSVMGPVQGPAVPSTARTGAGPVPADCGAAAAAGLPSQQKTQAGACVPAGRRSMDAHRSASAAAGESQSRGMLCAVAAPSWAGPSWHPKADVDSTQPAKKGTGVFMPRTAA